MPPSCKWEPVKRGRLPVPGGMRRPPGTGRFPSSYCSSCLVDKAMIFIIQIVIFIITKPIPPGPGRFPSRWPTFCHHFINDWLLSSLWSSSGVQSRYNFYALICCTTERKPVYETYQLVQCTLNCSDAWFGLVWFDQGLRTKD